MAKNPLIKEILDKYAAVWALAHSMRVMGWDMETHMPEAGAKSRGMATGEIAVMLQKATVSMDGLVSKAEKQRDLSDRDKGIVRELGRMIDYYRKIPPEMVSELERVTTEATVVWRTARKKSDFSLFKPHLEKIVRLKQEEAEKLGYRKHPYNALLDRFEEGFTVSDADRVFSRLIPGTAKILDKVSKAGVFPTKHPLQSVRYKTEAMERVNEGILQLLNMPKTTFRMDVSTHPFTTGIAPDDVRITTRYEGVDFKSTMFSTIHESGHALYELGVGEDLRYTPIGDGASYGIHESQSRFWENAMGRSKEFVKLVNPLLRKNLPFLSRYDQDDLYYYFNVVRKSFIRVDADELTYNMHIALRYDIEKKIIAGDVKVSELPELWDDTFDALFGIRPSDDARGVLQDVHWSGGSLGYFATYSLGNVVLGMIWHKMGDGKMIRDSVGSGDLMPLKEWLGMKIHRWGAMYTPKELQQRELGEAYNPEWLLKYYEGKFLQ
jgi:carboxypeptidase Taq